MKKTAAMVLLSAMTIYYVLREVTRLKLPKHMCGHPVIFEENFLREDVARSLRDLTKEMKTFPTNVNDLKFYKTEHEHIGEATEITTNGTCDHPFLVPSIERSKCVIPGRIDIGKWNRLLTLKHTQHLTLLFFFNRKTLDTLGRSERNQGILQEYDFQNSKFWTIQL